MIKNKNNINLNNNARIKKTIFRNFYPDFIYKSVESIPYSFIEKNNIKLVMIDMDNTIIDYYKREYSKEIKEWTKRMKMKGVKIYILSNSMSGKTVRRIADELDIDYHYSAFKPFLKGFKQIMKKENIEKENMLMVGDQIFTDVLGGNRFGIKTLLVNPINSKEKMHTKLKRPIEKVVLKKYKKDEENS